MWNEAESRERDSGETLKIRSVFLSLARLARKTLRFTDFFTDFEEKTDRFAVYYWLNHIGNLTVGANEKFKKYTYILTSRTKEKNLNSK